jgi:DNA-binding Lrp family transcriptional regulator
MLTPRQRQQQIMEWLQAERSLAIDALAERLGVSAMTIHRDLDHLASSGQVQKVYGAVEWVEAQPSHERACEVCHAQAPDRTLFTIQLKNGEQRYACCPHCGLLMMSDDVALALTPDFLYGHMVNVTQAVYVIESRVHLCCVPSALCFTSIEDAQSFQHGFGGKVMTFEIMMKHVRHQHHS